MESESAIPDAWVVIPARGGSVGIPRKNLRRIAGKPLIGFAIDTALQILPPDRVVVITDDAEIAAVAERSGARVLRESTPTPPDETLDRKIVRNLPRLRNLGVKGLEPILTVQPTSPLLKPATLLRAVEALRDAEVKSVLTVVEDRHLRWHESDKGDIVPLFSERLNRQQLPPEYRETGGVIGARLSDIERTGTRVMQPARVLLLDEREAIDIDTYSDLYAAAHLLSRKRIAVRVDASMDLGMGHVYRMLALASELARHELTIYLSDGAPLGQKFFEAYPYHVESVANASEFLERLTESQPDIIVLDLLDTEASDIAKLRAATSRSKIVSFEDRGSGASEVDLLVAEFIDSSRVPAAKKIEGIDFALLSPAFEVGIGTVASPAHVVQEVLVLFGGTDPSGLAVRALGSLARLGYSGRVTVARGLGATPLEAEAAGLPYTLEVLENVQNMPSLMSRADIAFTSAGRTIIELIACGVPAICLAQNEKELTHNHAVAENGVCNLGLGMSVTDRDLDNATRAMLSDYRLRHEYAGRARRAGSRRSNRGTISTILTRLGLGGFPDI